MTPLGGLARIKDLVSHAAISSMSIASATRDAEQERLLLLFRQARATSIVAALAATVTAVMLYWASPQPGPFIWLGAILAITAARQLLYRRFFRTRPGAIPAQRWLRWHALAAVPIGCAAGSLPLLDLSHTPVYIQQLQVLVPALVVMAAITSFGVYLRQYLVLLITTVVALSATTLLTHGSSGIPVIALFSLFAPILALTASRYADSITNSLRSKHQSERLVVELTQANNELEHHNSMLARQQDLIQQEEALAQHVFRQLTLGGDHELPGIHSWNQSMGSLSGDLTQTARGPQGQAYVFLADFTGHGLPAALGALPASSVFLAMAAKGLPVETIAVELNRKLHQLLPIGYFCCAVLLELAPDRRRLNIWNGGLPPILLQRNASDGYERIASHSVPLGVLSNDEFDGSARHIDLAPGDLVYAYTDGLTEAENLDGEMWGAERLEHFLLRSDLDTPKLPALIDAVLDHVNLAPASDDISVVELIAAPELRSEADAA